MDFNNDRQTWDINNEYMFGKALLVAPIVETQYTPEKMEETLEENEGWARYFAESTDKAISVDFTPAKSKKVYLPQDTKWYDFFTNEAYEGGKEIEISTHLNTIPLFARAGSIIPIEPDVQYTGEKSWDNLTIKVFPGGSGSFTLYEDEGDNYNYEKGAYTEINMTWNDKSQMLTIAPRKGNYEGMITNRTFNIELLNGKKQSVSYNGKQIKVKL